MDISTFNYFLRSQLATTVTKMVDINETRTPPPQKKKEEIQTVQ